MSYFGVDRFRFGGTSTRETDFADNRTPYRRMVNALRLMQLVGYGPDSNGNWLDRSRTHAGALR